MIIVMYIQSIGAQLGCNYLRNTITPFVPITHFLVSENMLQHHHTPKETDV